MPTFGTRSKTNLSQCHPILQEIANHAISKIDFTVICGNRGRADQEDAFRRGASKAHFGQSPHNYSPAAAFDFIPSPFTDADWDNNAKFKAIADVLIQSAKELGHVDKNGVPIVRWGGDWNKNGSSKDDKFVDTPHFELDPWREYIK